MIDYLFICSQNYRRSPTAEHVARSLGYKAISGGTDLDAIRYVTIDDMERADRIICMENHHARKIKGRITRAKRDPGICDRIEVWDILDIYDYCQPDLVEIIRSKLVEKPRG